MPTPSAYANICRGPRIIHILYEPGACFVNVGGICSVFLPEYTIGLWVFGEKIIQPSYIRCKILLNKISKFMMPRRLCRLYSTLVG